MSEKDSGGIQENQFQYDVAYYQAIVGAAIQTRFDADKSLLALSSGGIGLLVTLFTTAPISSDISRALFALSILAFLGTIFTILDIFKRNRDYLESLTGPPEVEDVEADDKLDRMDRSAARLFKLAVLSSVLSAVISLKVFADL